MNTDILRGKWMQIKGQIKQRWAKLTDDDVKYIEGNLEQAAGRLRERYGYAREQAEQEWNEFMEAWTNEDATDDRPQDDTAEMRNEPDEPAEANADRKQGSPGGRPGNPSPNPKRAADEDEFDRENEQGV